MSDHVEDKLFVIVGNGRSGTTLLAAMMDRHPQIAVPSETHYFTRLRNPFLSLFGMRNRRRTHDAWLRRQHFRSRRVESMLDLDWIESRFREGPATPARFFWLALQSYARSRGKTIPGEKTPGHIDYLDEILSGIPSAKAVCLIRDGRDVVRSFVNADFSHRNVWLHARRWNRWARVLSESLARWPDRTLLVKYEELVIEPEQTLLRVCGYLGVALDQRQLDPHVETSVIDDNEISWKNKINTPVDRSRAYAWRRDLDAREARLQTRMMSRWLAHFGYSASEAQGMTPKEYVLLLARAAGSELVIKPAYFSALWTRAIVNEIRRAGAPADGRDHPHARPATGAQDHHGE